MNRLSKIQAALLLAVALWPDEVKRGHFVQEEKINGIGKDLDRVLDLNDKSQWPRIAREYTTQAMNVAYSESAKHGYSYSESEVETIASDLAEDLISLSNEEVPGPVAQEHEEEAVIDPVIEPGAELTSESNPATTEAPAQQPPIDPGEEIPPAQSETIPETQVQPPAEPTASQESSNPE
jgi:hypothetical protein